MKFVPSLSTLCAPLGPLLNKKLVYHWNGSHTSAFEDLKTQIVSKTEKKPFTYQKNSRIEKDASHSGLGSSMKQGDGEARITIAFSPRFLNPHGIKLPTEELELLRDLWATEHFKNYLYGSHFEILTDHKTLLSALIANHGNKTMHSRLTCCVNRLFKFGKIPGKEMGFTDLLSRLPSGKAFSTSRYDNEFLVLTVTKITDNLFVFICTKKNCKKDKFVVK